MAVYTMRLKGVEFPKWPHTELYGVFEQRMEGASQTNDRAVAYCTSLEDAERVKALLVYYGEHFPAQAPQG